MKGEQKFSSTHTERGRGAQETQTGTHEAAVCRRSVLKRKPETQGARRVGVEEG